jgi:hypothetical protein
MAFCRAFSDWEEAKAQGLGPYHGCRMFNLARRWTAIGDR